MVALTHPRPSRSSHSLSLLLFLVFLISPLWG
nr:MAG TPA: hypothetical protein [Bacteriophage sp.]